MTVYFYQTLRRLLGKLGLQEQEVIWGLKVSNFSKITFGESS